LLEEAQQDVLHRYHYYEQLASLPREEDGTLQPPHRKLASAIKAAEKGKREHD